MESGREKEFFAAFPKGFAVAPAARARLLAQFELDLTFLERMQLRDYSLLLCVDPLDDAGPSIPEIGQPRTTGTTMNGDQYVLRMMLIDVLLKWVKTDDGKPNLSKKQLSELISDRLFPASLATQISKLNIKSSGRAT
ncbi:unnamed protein product, partial [Mesorhabditis spiculigera]